MTTSNPNVTPPAGGADPELDNEDKEPGILAGRLDGAVPDAEDPDTDLTDADETDSVEDDRKRSGA